MMIFLGVENGVQNLQKQEYFILFFVVLQKNPK